MQVVVANMVSEYHFPDKVEYLFENLDHELVLYLLSLGLFLALIPAWFVHHRVC